MCRGRGGNILVVTVVKAKVGELEHKVREVFFSHTRKELTGVLLDIARRTIARRPIAR